MKTKISPILKWLNFYTCTLHIDSSTVIVIARARCLLGLITNELMELQV